MKNQAAYWCVNQLSQRIVNPITVKIHDQLPVNLWNHWVFANFPLRQICQNTDFLWPVFSTYFPCTRKYKCMGSARIRCFSGPYFPSFGLNTDKENSEEGQFLSSVQVRENRILAYFTQYYISENSRTFMNFHCKLREVFGTLPNNYDGIFCSTIDVLHDFKYVSLYPLSTVLLLRKIYVHVFPTFLCLLWHVVNHVMKLVKRFWASQNELTKSWT